MGNDMLLWDEFDPNLYNLHVQIKQGEKVDSRTVNFGMREFSIDGRWFYVNGRKTILRGTVENCCFPLTGYAPMDQKSWERVFRICKDFEIGRAHV